MTTGRSWYPIGTAHGNTAGFGVLRNASSDDMMSRSASELGGWWTRGQMKPQVNHMAIQAVHGYTRMPSIFEQHQDFQHIYIYIYTMDIYRGYGVFTETCWKSTLSTWSGVDSGFWGSEVFTGTCTRRTVSGVYIQMSHRSSLLLPSFDIIVCNIVISYHIVSYHSLILCSIICHMSCCNIVSYPVILYHIVISDGIVILSYCHIVYVYCPFQTWYPLTCVVSYHIYEINRCSYPKMPDCTEHMYLVLSPKPATSKPGVGFVSVNDWN